MKSLRIQHEELRRFGRAILLASGSNTTEAGIVADHLVEANLCGHDSHGVGLLPTYMRDRLAGKLHANKHPRLVRDDNAIAIFDGGMGYGHVLAREVTEWGIKRARDLGVSVVALRNAYHVARIGSYGEQVCDAGLISLMFVNVVFGAPRVAPFGGADGRLHTNPVCIAVPGGATRPPIILDFATSRIAIGKVRVAYNENRKLPTGVLIDAQGLPTDDAAVVFEEPFGSLLPFGEHKGSGLALMCELLAGALTGGPTNQSCAPRDDGLINNMLAIFIDPERFTQHSIFEREVDAILRHVTASPPATPGRPVMIAGEPERMSRADRLASGVPIDEKSWGEILAAARQCGAS